MEQRMRKQYEKGKWNGIPNYQCLQCRFATLDEDLIIKHVKSHPPLPEPVVIPRKPRKKIEKVDEPEKGIEQWP